MIKLSFFSDIIKIFVLKMDVLIFINSDINLYYNPINIVSKHKPIYYKTYYTGHEINTFFKYLGGHNVLINIRKNLFSKCEDDYVYHRFGEYYSRSIMKENIIFKIHESFIEAYFIFILILIHLYKNIG